MEVAVGAEEAGVGLVVEVVGDQQKELVGEVEEWHGEPDLILVVFNWWLGKWGLVANWATRWRWRWWYGVEVQIRRTGGQNKRRKRRRRSW